jgi:hypothetical protein
MLNAGSYANPFTDLWVLIRFDKILAGCENGAEFPWKGVKDKQNHFVSHHHPRFLRSEA